MLAFGNVVAGGDASGHARTGYDCQMTTVRPAVNGIKLWLLKQNFINLYVSLYLYVYSTYCYSKLFNLMHVSFFNFVQVFFLGPYTFLLQNSKSCRINGLSSLGPVLSMLQFLPGASVVAQPLHHTQIPLK